MTHVDKKYMASALAMIERFMTRYDMGLEKAISLCAVSTMIPLVDLRAAWKEHVKEQETN